MNIHVRITPRNSILEGWLPVTAPRSYLSAEEIQQKESEGLTVLFVVEEKKSASGSKGLKPLRDTVGRYLVIVCQ